MKWRYLQSMYDKAEKANEANILSMLESNTSAVLLDCGCGGGEFTLKVAEKLGTKSLFGLETVEDLIDKARLRGINITQMDLNKKFPFKDKTIYVICSNQVIEHLYDTDNFISEIHRILKKGGYAVISTENLASWHNIFSLLFGWQPFSLTNISSCKLGIGNPLSLHRGKNLSFSSWQHIRIFTYRGLKEIFETKGFKVEKILGSGYYPLPNLLARIDTRHAAFLTIKVRKV